MELLYKVMHLHSECRCSPTDGDRNRGSLGTAPHSFCQPFVFSDRRNRRIYYFHSRTPRSSLLAIISTFHNGFVGVSSRSPSALLCPRDSFVSPKKKIDVDLSCYNFLEMVKIEGRGSVGVQTRFRHLWVPLVLAALLACEAFSGSCSGAKDCRMYIFSSILLLVFARISSVGVTASLDVAGHTMQNGMLRMTRPFISRGRPMLNV